MTTSVQVRQVVPDAPERERAYGALLAAYLIDHGDEMADDYHAQVAEVRAAAAHAALDHRLSRFVADADGNAVGCVSVKTATTSAEIRYLYVRREARRMGVARALMIAAMDAARTAGAREIRLTTAESMAPAQALYRSLGFEVVDGPTEGACRAPVHFQRVLRA